MKPSLSTRRLIVVISILLTPLVLAAALFAALGPGGLEASSHREAPLISQDPFADTTDVYAFISIDNPSNVTLIANWIPFEGPEGGPNYFRFADDVLYEIHVDNNGDAMPDITYQFEFKTEKKNLETFLYNTGPVTSLDDPDLNVTQSYTLTLVSGKGSPGETSTVLGTNFRTPPVNIGSKSTPNYEALAAAAVHVRTTPQGPMRLFAGPRDDPFFVDLGSVFDLLSLRGQAPPVGYPLGPTVGVDGLGGYNVHSIAVQAPIAALTQGEEPVIGVWATSSRRAFSTRGSFGHVTQGGPWVQVSRLGMPLVNEVVLPLALKDAFNSIPPRTDLDLLNSGTPAGDLLAKSVLDPELQRLLNALYGVPHPSDDRLDLFAIFMTGMVTTKPFTINTPGGPVTLPAGTNVNQPAGVRAAEMLRLNTAMPFRPGVMGSVCSPQPNYQLGLLGGDACGFPNGRRLQDDVTDISLLAVAGAAYSVLTDDTFSFNPALIGVLTDSVDQNDKPFMNSFPYLATPHQGQEHYHPSIWRQFLTSLKNLFGTVGPY